MPHKTEAQNRTHSLKKKKNNDYKCQGKHTHGDTDLNLPLYQTHSLKKTWWLQSQQEK